MINRLISRFTRSAAPAETVTKLPGLTIVHNPQSPPRRPAREFMHELSFAAFRTRRGRDGTHPQMTPAQFEADYARRDAERTAAESRSEAEIARARAAHDAGLPAGKESSMPWRQGSATETTSRGIMNRKF